MLKNIDINVDEEIKLILMEEEKKKLLLEVNDSAEFRNMRAEVKIEIIDFLNKRIKELKEDLNKEELAKERVNKNKYI